MAAGDASTRPEEPWRREVRERCEVELAAGPQAMRAARLRYELARATRDPREALRHLDLALEAHPDHLPSLRLARQLRVALRDAAEACSLFDREIRLEPEPSGRAALWFQKGRLLEDVARDREAARSCYEEASRLHPGEPAFHRALALVNHQGRSWEAVASAQRGEANALRRDPSGRAALLCERARLLETRLERPDEAIELYRRALTLDPDAGRAQHALKRLLHGRARWGELCGVLEREAAQTTDLRVRAQALFQVGRIQSERLGQSAEAAEALGRAMQVAPSDRLLHDCLERLYTDAGDPSRLAHVLAHAVETVVAPHERIGLMARIGELFERTLQDRAQAIRWYEAALQIEATFLPALAALDRLYEASQQWEALIVMHLAAAEDSRDTRRRAAAHARIAGIFEDRMGQPEEAMRHHRQALALSPEHQASFKALVRLYRIHRHHRALVELYERGLEATAEQDLRFSYLFAIGTLYEDELAAPDEAVHTYRRILAEDPEHLAALHALQRAAERAGGHRDLVEALEAEARLSGDPAREVALLHHAGNILAQALGDRDAALARFRQVLEIDDQHTPSLDSMAEVLQALGRHADLREIYERQLALSPAGPGQVSLLYQLGSLSLGQLADEAGAIAYFRRAIAADPGHGPSLRALAELLWRAGDHHGLVEVLDAEIRSAASPEALAAAGYRLGELYEVHLADDEKALAAYRRALAADPRHRPAIDGCIRVQERLQAWDAQASALEEEARRVEDPRLAIEALLRAGAIYTDLLSRPLEAISAYEGVRSIDPQHPGALLALEPLYREGGPEAQAKLADLYRTQAQTAAEPQARLTALGELARLLGSGGDRELLKQTFLSMLGEDPTHSASQLGPAQLGPAQLGPAQLGPAQLGPAQLGGALLGLSTIARDTGDRKLAAEVAARLARAEWEPSVIASCHASLGESLELDQPEAALRAFQDALRGDPESIAAIRGVVRTAERCADHHALVDALDREAEWTSDGRAAAEARVRAAKVRLERLGDRAGAIDGAAQALGRFPDHAEAARISSELLREEGEIDRLITLLTRAASEARTSSRRASLWRVVARLYADEKDDVGAGVAALERLLGEETIEAATWALVGELRGRNQQWDDAVTAYHHALSTQPSREIKLRVLMALGRLYAEQLGQPSRAVEALRGVVALDPEQRDALLLLLHLHQRARHHESVVEVVAQLSHLPASSEERAWLLRERAAAELALQRRSAAAATLHEAVVIEGPMSEAAKSYKQLLGDDEPWTRYVEALEKHLVATRRGEVPRRCELREVYMALARIEHEVLLEVDRAVSTLRRGLEAVGVDPVLHHELAERLRTTGQRRAALDEYRKMIEHDPIDVQAWRGMAGTLHEDGRKLESGVVLAPLVLLREATDLEAGMARQRRAPIGWCKPGALDRGALSRLSAGDALDEERIVELLDTLGEALPKLHPPDYQRYGVTPRDRLELDHPLRARVGELAERMALDDLDVYLHDAAERDVGLILAERPALMVPRPLADLPEGQRTFLLARALMVVARGSAPALILGRTPTQLLTAAAVHSVAPHHGGQPPDERLEKTAKRLSRALSRRHRKHLEQVVVPRWLSERQVDLERWGPTIRRSATRAAALLTNDLPAVARALQHTGEARPTSLTELVTGSPLVADLFRFWSSASAFELRIAAGIV